MGDIWAKALRISADVGGALIKGQEKHGPHALHPAVFQGELLPPCSLLLAFLLI